MQSFRRPPASRLAGAFALPLLVSALLASCGGGGGGDAPPTQQPPVTGPDGRPSAMSMAGGDGQQGVVGAELATALSARVTDSGGHPVAAQGVTFRVVSGGGNVTPAGAQTDADGRASARWTLGTAAADSQVVEASVQTAAGARTVRFRAGSRAAAPARVAAALTTMELPAAGDSALLQATAADAYGNPTPSELRWTSEDAAVASVDLMSGWVKARGAGSTRIFARAGTFADTVAVSVRGAPPVGGAVRLVVSPENLRFRALGDTLRVYANALNAQGAPVPGVNVTFTVVPTDVSVIGMRPGGLVEARGNGTRMVVASAGTLTDTARVTVQQEPAVVQISAGATSVPVGGAVTFTAQVGDANNWIIEGETPVWSVSDTRVASINASTGRFTALSAGSTRVTARAGNAVDEVTVQVTSTPSNPVSVGNKILTAANALTCGRSAQGPTLCWGANGFQQTGGGGGTMMLTPQPASGEKTFVAVSAGGDHACGLTSTGEAFCWGRNDRGQLGLGTVGGPNWGAVAGGYRFVSISAGSLHSCGITGTGEALCWGANSHGQIGIGTGEGDRSRPTATVTTTRFREVASGGLHTCAIATTGFIHCWGGSPSDSGIPGLESSAAQFSQISSGGLHSCAVTPVGSAYCWGSNDGGQLGSGTKNAVSGLVRVPGGPYTAIAAGGRHSCATTAAATLCWGSNTDGQLGDRTFTDRLVPTEVLSWYGDAMRGRAIAAGGRHTCVLESRGLFCWGANAAGQLGRGDTSPQGEPWPVYVPSGLSWP